MRKSLAVSALCLSLTVPAFAQNTDIEALAGVQFNFGNPGARSLGMGGAFLGLADDASAAEANPAGLTILQKKEFSIEGRNFRNEIELSSTGDFLSNSGPNALVTENFSSFSRRAQLAFASVVIPVGNLRVAGYFHQSLDYEMAGSSGIITNSSGQLELAPINFFVTRAGGAVTRDECIRLQTADPNGCGRFLLFPYVTAVDIDMKTSGVALAYKIGNFSIGGAARYQVFEEIAASERYDTTSGAQVSTVVQGTLNTTTFDAQEEDDITFSAGFKWATSGQRFSIGGVYKQGPEFEAPVFTSQNSGQFVQRPGKATTFHVPDIAGIGVSVAPFTTSLLSGLRLNADAINVQYSNLVDNFSSIFQGVDNTAFEAEDVVEFHAGAELLLPTKIPVFIRTGWWLDPAHGLEFTGAQTGPAQVAETILFPGSSDQHHYSVGVGLAWPSFQIDAAYDTSDSIKVGSISMVTRF